MIRKSILFILPAMMYGLSYGQGVVSDSLVTYAGFVLKASDSSAVANAHILNLSKGTGTVSSEDGSFKLLVRNQDTLKFSCIGLQEQYFFVNTNIQRPSLLIFLERDTIMMEEVRISPLPQRRFFKYVFLETKVPVPEDTNLNMGFMLKNDPAYVPPTGIRFTGPVQALYNTFNKKARLDRKLRHNRKKYSKYLIPEEGDSLVFPDN